MTVEGAHAACSPPACIAQSWEKLRTWNGPLQFSQLEGFGSTVLLTPAEDRKLGRKIQSPLALGGLKLVWNVLGRFWLQLKMNRGTEMHVFAQLEGFGSTALLTATEERKLGRKVQSLLALEAKRNEAMERLGRDSLTTAEWMAEASITDAKEYKKILKVRSPSARIGSVS